MSNLVSDHSVETAPAASETPANSNVQILVVDDDDLIRQVVSRVLLASGYKVNVAEDGTAGWAALQWGNYDLLITDHNMPKLTGVGLVQKLWSAQMWLPVILMSGALPMEELESHSWLEFVSLLAKPFSAELLLTTVSEALHAPAETRQPAERGESMLPPPPSATIQAARPLGLERISSAVGGPDRARPLFYQKFCRHVDGEEKQTTNKEPKDMTTLEIKGDWNITKGKLRQKWAKLTDDDLQYAEGKQDELIGRIQKRTGETREAVEKAVKETCSSCGS